MSTKNTAATPSEQTATRVDEAVQLVAELLREANQLASVEPKATRRARTRIAAVVGNADAQSFMMSLTDEVLRIHDPRRAARRFGELTRDLPRTGLGRFDKLLLQAGGRIAPVMPALVMGLVTRRLRNETRSVIVAADDPTFAEHVAQRRSAGIRSNVNVLGEAILGDAEAQRRLLMVIERLERRDVDYISVKISAISAYVNALAFEETVDAVAERLRTLYRVANTARPAKFVNLDMEEYRDLGLTTAVFRQILDEPEFHQLPAGIVLQAYLPDSHGAARELADWARDRVAAGGAPIKIRLVKGANLAMEMVEAELHDWPLATFATKAEVDASYKVLLGLLLEPQYDDSVRIGLASHNLFDVAWGLLASRDLAAAGRAGRLEFEMLEGMAMAEAAVVQARTGHMLLYSPVVSEDDFVAAIAYLVRRLDENTTPDNYLTAAFEIEPGNATFKHEAEKFRAAVNNQTHLDLARRRTQNRNTAQLPTSVETAFVNSPDTDFTLPENRRWIASHLAHPVLLAAQPTASAADVDAAVALAVNAQHVWANVGGIERARLINRVGDVIEGHRGEILATMAYETGKTVAQGDPEVSEAVDFARYYARSIAAIDQLAANGTHSEPLGPVVVAPPWNFPYAIAAGGVLAALAAGNTAILKPAPQAHATAALVAQHCWEAGIPAEVLQLIAAPDDDAGRRLITHPDVQAVILTGGYATAQMFASWKPTLRLHAETSGKNSMIITATADLDLAIHDLVRSSFGHAGQKCSATSLAIVEASVYDNPDFQRQLADAVTTLRVGPAHLLGTDIGPLIEAPGESLQRALTTLEPGETWLVQPHQNDDQRQWTPGVRLGVQPGSWFARTECFGPVLGIIRAENLEQAMMIQNDNAFGLTAGLHALDPQEIELWSASVAAGNLYINRGTTGAIVQRQPFGGWKQSSIGPTAKAGGPRYVSSLRHWPTPIDVDLDAVQSTFTKWASTHLTAELDPTGLGAETNVQRFRPYPHRIALRVGANAALPAVDLALAAAATTGTRIAISMATTETDEAFASRLADERYDRLRLIGEVGDVIRIAAHRADIVVDGRPICAEPSIELPRWLQEQSVSHTRHRHGRMPA